MESLESHTLNAFSKNIELTDHQKAVLKQIDEFTRTHLKEDGHAVFVLMGDAGTGKSLILNQLFTKLAQEVDDSYFLVNHPELLKVYRELAGQTPHMLKNIISVQPASLIKCISRINTLI